MRTKDHADADGLRERRARLHGVLVPCPESALAQASGLPAQPSLVLCARQPPAYACPAASLVRSLACVWLNTSRAWERQPLTTPSACLAGPFDAADLLIRPCSSVPFALPCSRSRAVCDPRATSGGGDAAAGAQQGGAAAEEDGAGPSGGPASSSATSRGGEGGGGHGEGEARSGDQDGTAAEAEATKKHKKGKSEKEKKDKDKKKHKKDKHKKDKGKKDKDQDRARPRDAGPPPEHRPSSDGRR
jgi:hypothetical protein